MAEEKIIVNAGKLKKLAIRELQAVGVPEGDAEIMADVLVTADLRGVETHGIALFVGFYIKGIQEGRINPKPDMKIIDSAPSVATMDGGNGLGYVVTYHAMKKAISLAEQAGTGFVSVANSTHFGPAFYYSMMALEHDMIGVTLTCSPVSEVVAPGTTSTAVGTNPISVAAPANKKYPFVMDMATSVVAAGKVRKAVREGKPLPDGWVIDRDGNSMNDPNKWTRETGALLPLGGTPDLGVYKGFALGVTVDVLTALLTGFPPAVLDRTRAVSHLVGAFDIKRFVSVETFKNLMDEMIEGYDNLPKLPGIKNIYIAGGHEAELQKDREANGIPILTTVLKTLKDTAEELGVEYDLE